MNRLRQHPEKILSVAVSLLFIVIVFAIGKFVPQEIIHQIITQAGPFGPVVYILLSLITCIIAPLSGTPLLFVGYYAYGDQVVYYTFIVSIISSVINFWIARKWGRALVAKLVGKKSAQKIDTIANEYGLVTLFFLRMFQGGLHDFISYASGLTPMRFRDYFIVSTLGIIPSSALWYVLSQYATNPWSFMIINTVFAVVLSVIFLIGTMIVKRKNPIKLLQAKLPSR